MHLKKAFWVEYINICNSGWTILIMHIHFFSSQRPAWTHLPTYSIVSFIYLPSSSTEVGYFINFNLCLLMILISTWEWDWDWLLIVFLFCSLEAQGLGDACFLSKISQYISENKLMFILTHPFMISDFSTFLQFTRGIRASNGGARESQVVGRKKGNSVISVMVAESQV